MTKLTIKATTPSEELIKNSTISDVVVVDGRTINIKEPGVLSEFRIVEIVGAKSASNAVFMSMILPVQWVTHIDGIEVPQPQNRLELDALIQRLGSRAIVAIGNALAKIGEKSGSDDTVKK